MTLKWNNRETRSRWSTSILILKMAGCINLKPETITLEVFCGMKLVNSVLESSEFIYSHKVCGFWGCLLFLFFLCMLQFIPAIYINKSCQKPTTELAGRLREKLNISPLDIGHEWRAVGLKVIITCRYESQESIFHLYSTLHKTMSQGITVAAYPERGVGNDPEPLGVAFLQGPPFTLRISLTLSHSSCLSLSEIINFA